MCTVGVYRVANLGVVCMISDCGVTCDVRVVSWLTSYDECAIVCAIIISCGGMCVCVRAQVKVGGGGSGSIPPGADGGEGGSDVRALKKWQPKDPCKWLTAQTKPRLRKLRLGGSGHCSDILRLFAGH